MGLYKIGISNSQRTGTQYMLQCGVRSLSVFKIKSRVCLSCLITVSWNIFWVDLGGHREVRPFLLQFICFILNIQHV